MNDTPMTTWDAHLTAYHKTTPDQIATLRAFTGNPGMTAEEAHRRISPGCAWTPGMCAGTGPHAGWWCCSSGPQGDAATYQCGWCAFRAKGRDLEYLADIRIRYGTVDVTRAEAVEYLATHMLTERVTFTVADPGYLEKYRELSADEQRKWLLGYGSLVIASGRMVDGSWEWFPSTGVEVWPNDENQGIVLSVRGRSQNVTLSRGLHACHALALEIADEAGERIAAALAP